MARLAAQEALCFFPTSNDAGEALLKHLQFAAPKEGDRATEYHILDPCAGQGAVLKQITDGLHVPYKNVYAVELDKGRGEAIRQALPGANILAPCSLFSTFISHRSFSLIYCNPPFDDQMYGGGREETTFVKESYSLLGDNGVIVVVAPLRTFNTYEFRGLLDTHFKEMQLYRFPEPKFGEVVMIGRKRSTILEDSGKNESSLLSRYKLSSHSRDFDYKLSRYRGVNDVMDLPALGTVACDWENGCPGEAHAMIRVWDVPVSWKPSRFAKGDYLPEELIEAIDQSPNNAIFREAKDPPIQESPLPLERGHVALLVTSGALDGLIEVPGVGSHVMRGISRKVEYANDEMSKAVLSEDGNSMRVTEVYSEQMDTKIRAIDGSFTIYTFGVEPRKVDGNTREYEMAIETAEGESGAFAVPLIRDGNSDYIRVNLCGQREVTFVFDTGAEICQLSAREAKGLKFFLTTKLLRLIGAHGVVVNAKEAIITSMSVAGLTAKNVKCAIVDDSCGDVPALLGQNFLRLFDYQYSQRSGTLTLSLAKKEETTDGE